MLWLKLTQLEMSWCLVLSPRTWLVMIQSNVKNIFFFLGGGCLPPQTQLEIVWWFPGKYAVVPPLQMLKHSLELWSLAWQSSYIRWPVICTNVTYQSFVLWHTVVVLQYIFFTSRVAHIYDLGDTCTYVLCLRVFHFNYVKNNLTRSSSQDLSDVFCVPLGGSKPPGWKLA